MLGSPGSDESDSILYDYEVCQPRKRQRLTHLSPGEKLQRRKLKNRVAAQAARDRKKAYVDELLEMIQKLKEENSTLAKENAALRLENTCPNCANVPVTSTPTERSSSSALVKPEPTSKSAALSPLQKDRTQALLALLISYSLISMKATLSNSTVTSKVVTTLNMDSVQTHQQSLPSKRNHPFQQWWGPQQSSWNPSKTL